MFFALVCVILTGIRATDSVRGKTASRKLQLSCPTGQYDSGSGCASCGDGCSLCSDGYSCFTCIDGYYLIDTSCFSCNVACKTCFYFSAYQCLTCASGYYSNDINSCRLCAGGCETCTDDSSTSCTRCMENYQIKDGVCTFTLPDSPTTTTLTTGAIVGIAVGGFACFMIILVSCICISKRAQLKKKQQLGTGGTISSNNRSSPGCGQQMPQSEFGSQPFSNQPPQINKMGFLNQRQGPSNNQYPPQIQSTPDYSLPPGFSSVN